MCNKLPLLCNSDHIVSDWREKLKKALTHKDITFYKKRIYIMPKSLKKWINTLRAYCQGFYYGNFNTLLRVLFWYQFKLLKECQGGRESLTVPFHLNYILYLRVTYQKSAVAFFLVKQFPTALHNMICPTT